MIWHLYCAGAATAPWTPAGSGESTCQDREYTQREERAMEKREKGKEGKVQGSRLVLPLPALTTVVDVFLFIVKTCLNHF